MRETMMTPSFSLLVPKKTVTPSCTYHASHSAMSMPGGDSAHPQSNHYVDISMHENAKSLAQREK